MIAELRRWHRRQSYVLIPLALAVLGLSHLARGPVWEVAQPEISADWATQQVELGGTRWHLALEESPEPQARRWLRIAAEQRATAPDLWLYLADRPPRDMEALPPGARLLGRWQGSELRLELPAVAASTVVLCWYSLAHAECLGTTVLERQP